MTEFKLLLSDPIHEEVDAWIQEHNILCRVEVTDVSDVSYQWDEIAAYFFQSDKDRVMFALRWGK